MKFTLKKQGPSSSRPALSGGIGHQIATDPFLDWIIIFACALCIALVLVGTDISVYLASKDRLEAPVTLPPRTQALPLDVAAMNAALQSFDARSDSRSKILHGFSAPRDPSLP